MSTVLSIDSRELIDSIYMLSTMFPKGSSEIPVGFNLKDKYLTITCLQGCVYMNRFFVDTDDTFDITVLYRDLSPLIHHNMSLSIEHTPIGLTITGDNFTAEFQTGYSTVQVQTFGKLVFKDIVNNLYKDTLKDLWSMNLEKLYNITSPIIIRGDIAIQKYPNTWVQVRTTGLPFSAVLDIEHVKLMVKFNAESVSTDVPGTLIFKNRTAMLQIPCKVDNDTTSTDELLKKVGAPHDLHLNNYVDMVRQAAKLDNKSVADVVLYDNGIKTRVGTSNTMLSISDGNTNTEPLLICSYPIQLWLTFLKLISNVHSQALFGDDILCLRTTTILILTRVLR